MSRSLVHRWLFVVLLLGGLAVLTIRKDASGNSGSVYANSSPASGEGGIRNDSSFVRFFSSMALRRAAEAKT